MSIECECAAGDSWDSSAEACQADLMCSAPKSFDPVNFECACPFGEEYVAEDADAGTAAACNNICDTTDGESYDYNNDTQQYEC